MADPQDPQPTPHTAAQRIKDLNEIDTLATSSLNSAGLALRALTGPEIRKESNSSDVNTSASAEAASQSNDAAKADFEKHTREFFNAVQSLGARLRRQAYALEEAGIIAKEKEGTGTGTGSGNATQQSNGSASESQEQITNGGLGGLDVGWLNSRRDDVARRKEEELWCEARRLVEDWESTQGVETQNKSAGEEDSMDTGD